MVTSLAHQAMSGRVSGDGGLPLRKAFEVLLAWQERIRQRRALAALDDRLLRDLGLTRSMVGGEIEKPFWRP